MSPHKISSRTPLLIPVNISRPLVRPAPAALVVNRWCALSTTLGSVRLEHNMNADKKSIVQSDEFFSSFYPSQRRNPPVSGQRGHYMDESSRPMALVSHPPSSWSTTATGRRGRGRRPPTSSALIGASSVACARVPGCTRRRRFRSARVRCGGGTSTKGRSRD